MQLRTINKAIADTGLELVKGEGYFYFVGEGSELLKDSMVMVYRLNDLPLDSWIAEAKGKKAEIDAIEPYTGNPHLIKIGGRY